jgi:hypothetical protein
MTNRRYFDVALGAASSRVVTVLDKLSVDADAAYSLRKLRKAYTGSAIRVRRSSDNAELDIGFTNSGNLNTAALLAHCGASDGLVTTWYNQGYWAYQTRRNILTYSEDLSNAIWVKLNATITSNDVVAPSGKTTADRINSNTTSARHTATQAAGAGVASAVYTTSAYIKAGTNRYVILGEAGDAVWRLITIDTNDFTISGTSGVTSSAVTSVGNGWYRCSCTFTRTNVGTVNSFIGFSNSATNSSPPLFVGSTADDFYVWGLQTELGALTAYQPMLTGSAIDATQTNTANQPKIVSSGVVNVKNARSSLSFNGATNYLSNPLTSLGSVYSISAISSITSGTGVIVSGRGATANPLNPRLDYASAVAARFFIRDNAGTNSILSQNPVVTGAIASIIGIRDTDNASLTVNGSVISASSSPGAIGALTTTTGTGIGADVAPSAAVFLTGNISEICLHTSALGTTDRQTLENDQMQYYGI